MEKKKDDQVKMQMDGKEGRTEGRTSMERGHWDVMVEGLANDQAERNDKAKCEWARVG